MDMKYSANGSFQCASLIPRSLSSYPTNLSVNTSICFFNAAGLTAKVLPPPLHNHVLFPATATSGGRKLPLLVSSSASIPMAAANSKSAFVSGNFLPPIEEDEACSTYVL